MNTAITHRTAEGEAYKLCKCTKCGVVGTCTPSFDFYVLNDDENESDIGKPLLCEVCFQRAHGLRSLPPMEV
jgi:hypothetical protein